MLLFFLLLAPATFGLFAEYAVAATRLAHRLIDEDREIFWRIAIRCATTDHATSCLNIMKMQPSHPIIVIDKMLRFPRVKEELDLFPGSLFTKYALIANAARAAVGQHYDSLAESDPEGHAFFFKDFFDETEQYWKLVFLCGDTHLIDACREYIARGLGISSMRDQILAVRAVA